MKQLSDLRLSHRFHDLGEPFGINQPPQGLQQPQLVSASPAIAQQLGLDPAEFHHDAFTQIFSGNTLLPGSRPLAQAYAGHQFGHLRFGSFENLYYQRNHTALRTLADFTIHHYFPDCDCKGPERYAGFFGEVVVRTARLIAHWQAVGFVHGVMNSDNQSIIGVSLDLGAGGFTPQRDPDYVVNPIDEQGRYAFGQQPVIGLWNCNALARALSPLIPADQLRAALQRYEVEFLHHYTSLTGSEPTD